jgi:hypothetical protein
MIYVAELFYWQDQQSFPFQKLRLLGAQMCYTPMQWQTRLTISERRANPRLHLTPLRDAGEAQAVEYLTMQAIIYGRCSID